MPAESDRRFPLTEIALPLLGGEAQDGLDGLLPGGVYALVPQAPPARYALWARFLPAATRSGKVCHVLTRSDPADFLRRVQLSGWPDAETSWKHEALRIYAMADGFAKLLFRRDVSGLTSELAQWGVKRQHVLLVDAADALLSLHDLSLATSQLVKLRAWAKDLQISVLLNFSVAGAGVEKAELTSLMDHFSGLARLHADDTGPVITLEYWQSDVGTSAERTYLLQDDNSAYRLRLPTVRNNAAAPDDVGQKSLNSPGNGLPAFLHVTNDHVWAQELQMLTQSNWKPFDVVPDILAAAAGGAHVLAVLRFDAHSNLGTVAKEVHTLRSKLGNRVRIVVAEHRVSLRYANELVLLRLGADTVIRKDVDLTRWPTVLNNLDANSPRGNMGVDVDVDVALANAAMPQGHGFLSVKVFLDEVAASADRGTLLGVPFALGVSKMRPDRAIGDAVTQAQFRRNGDFLTTDGEKLYFLFNACSLTRGPSVLDSIFAGQSAEFLTSADWMSSQMEMQTCVEGLRARHQAHPFDVDQWTNEASLPAPTVDAVVDFEVSGAEAPQGAAAFSTLTVDTGAVQPAVPAQEQPVPAVVGARVSAVSARTFEPADLDSLASERATADPSTTREFTGRPFISKVESTPSALPASPLRRLAGLVSESSASAQSAANGAHR